jgi:hypothetical protein
MLRYYEPDLTLDPNSPFVRDAANKLVHAPPVLVSHFIGQLEGPTAFVADCFNWMLPRSP